MDNVQKHNTCTNILSSQTFRSYSQRTIEQSQITHNLGWPWLFSTQYMLQSRRPCGVTNTLKTDMLQCRSWKLFLQVSLSGDRLCGLVRVPGYRTEMYGVSCEVQTEVIYVMYKKVGPPLWSSGQSSWLQIRRPGFDCRHYQKKKSSGSGTGSTQPREYNWRATW
jgi:hypothetical protein